MHLLDTITITFAGLMVGNELAVSAFFNPAVWQLESAPQAQGLSILAGSLGRVMPIWYGLCLALLARGVVPASPSGCVRPSAHGNADLGGRHRLHPRYACTHQRPHCCLEHGGADAKLEARPQKVGLSPSSPHSVAGRGTSCPHLCIGCLSSAAYLIRKLLLVGRQTGNWKRRASAACVIGAQLTDPPSTE